MCGHYLNTLSKLLSREFNPHVDKFLRVICTIPANKIKDLDVGAHIESAGIRNCTWLCFEFLQTYLKENPKFDFSLLLKHPSALKAFKSWQKQQARGPGLAPAHQPLHGERPRVDTSILMSSAPAQVFRQGLSEEDIRKKQSQFVQKAKEAFESAGLPSVAKETLQTKVDVVNHDMALLRLTIPVALDKQFGKHSGLDIIRMKRSQQGGETSSPRPKTRSSDSFHGEEDLSRLISPTKCPKGDAFFSEGGNQARFSKKGLLEIKLRHGNRRYHLELALGKANLLHPNGSLFSLDFKTPSKPETQKGRARSHEKNMGGADSLEKENDMMMLFVAQDMCASQCSTGAESLASARDLEGATVIEGLEGTLAFTIRGGSIYSSSKSAQLIFDLLVSSRDKPSRELLERAVDMEPTLSRFLTGLFSSLAEH